MKRVFRAAGFGAIVGWSSSAVAAPIPQGVAAMITAASDSGDAAVLKTTVDLAKKTSPDSVTEIDALAAELKQAAAAQHLAALESETFLQGWKGQGQAGASLDTGNTHGRATSVGLRFEREGIRWDQLVLATGDYTREDDVTTQNRVFASYQGDYKFGDRWYGLGVGSYEHDRFAGYYRRFSEALGVGYKLIRRPDMSLRLEAGPAYRQTHFITGETQNRVGLRLATKYAWTLAPDVLFTEDAVYYAQSGDSTLTSTTALTAKIRGALSVQASFFYNHEQHPPLGLGKTDTTTRLTLVYGF